MLRKLLFYLFLAVIALVYFFDKIDSLKSIREEVISAQGLSNSPVKNSQLNRNETVNSPKTKE